MEKLINEEFESLEYLESERNKRTKEIQGEQENFSNQSKKQEEAFNEIQELFAILLKGKKTSEEENCRIDKIEKERQQDRLILIYAVKQIQQVIEMKTILDSRKLTKSPTKGILVKKKFIIYF